MNTELKDIINKLLLQYFDCGGSHSIALILDFRTTIEPLIDEAIQESYRKGYEDSLKTYSK
jgi:hypothetical protein